MQLNELEKNMSLLDQVLAKTNTEIKINVVASKSAQNKILKKYLTGFISSAILAVVFTISWIGKGVFQSFQPYLRGFLAIYLTIAALWNLFLYLKLKNIKISQLAPSKLFAKTIQLKIYSLSGEVVAALGLAVFFSLFLSDLKAVNPFAFWMCVTGIIVALVSSISLLPRYIKLLNDLNTIKE